MDYAIKAALAMLQNKLDSVEKIVTEIRDQLQADPNRVVSPGTGLFNEICPSCSKPVSFDPEHLGNCKVDKTSLIVICPYCSNEWMVGLVFPKETIEKGDDNANERTNPEPGGTNP